MYNFLVARFSAGNRRLRNYQVVVGDHDVAVNDTGEQWHRVKSVTTHPDYVSE